MLRASEKQNLENDDKPQRDIKVATRTKLPQQNRHGERGDSKERRPRAASRERGDTTLRKIEDEIRCARVGYAVQGGRANLSKYVWSLDIPKLFYRTIWAFAVKQARSLPDVFVVPVALWKWSFSQMEYFHSVYIPLERVFPTSDWTSTVNHRNVWLSETRCHHVIKKWIIHITQMQTHRLRISEAHEVRCLMIF